MRIYAISSKMIVAAQKYESYYYDPDQLTGAVQNNDTMSQLWHSLFACTSPLLFNVPQ